MTAAVWAQMAVYEMRQSAVLPRREHVFDLISVHFGTNFLFPKWKVSQSSRIFCSQSGKCRVIEDLSKFVQVHFGKTFGMHFYRIKLHTHRSNIIFYDVFITSNYQELYLLHFYFFQINVIKHCSKHISLNDY